MRIGRVPMGALAVLALGTALAFPAAGGERYVVLPLANATGESSLYWLGEATAMMASDHLLAAGEDVVAPERRREAQSEMGLEGAETMTVASAILLGRRLGATVVVHGEVSLRSDHGLALTGRVTRTEGDAGQSRPATVQGAISDLFKLQQQFVNVLLPATRGRADTTPVPILKEMRQVPLSSFEAYVKAVTADEPEWRRELLDRALEADPIYAAALIERARLEVDEGRPSSAFIFLDRVPLEETAFPERYWLARGDAAAAAGDRGSAIDSYRRALQARPTATAHFRLAAVLAQQGRLLESRDELSAGLTMDPSDPEGIELREALGSHEHEEAGG